MRRNTSRFGRTRQALLAAGSVALALGLLETGIWFVHAVVGGKPRLLRSDPELGWANRRGFEGSRRLGDGRKWRVSLDESGHRSLPLEAQRPAGRIVALGDSFVFGDGVDAELHFLTRLGRELPANVVNLGVVGYSTDQELLAFRRYGGGSDVVLLGTYLTNDLSGNLSHSGGHLLRFKPKFADCGTGGDDAQPQPVRHPLVNRARHRSYLVTLALGGLYRIAPHLELFDTPEPGDETAGGGAPWNCYEALVGRIVEEADRRGAGPVVILLWSYRSLRPDPGAAPALETRFADRDVRVIDLDRLVNDSGLDPGSLYHSPSVDPGAHWNAAGHAFVAEALLEALQGSGLALQHDGLR